MPSPAVYTTLEQLSFQRDVHLALGMFDGVHLGHRSVIESALHAGRSVGGKSGLITFDPHPSRILRPDQPTLMLMSLADRLNLFHETGIDFVVVLPFSMAFAALTAEAFLDMLVSYLPTLKGLHVGQNFHFGKGRGGDIAFMLEAGCSRGLNIYSVERFRFNGQPISSSRIRECLSQGLLETANDMLGYPYFSSGIIQGGKQLGRKLGFPTLNIHCARELKPCLGVYAVNVRVATDATVYPAVANYGVRPTIEDSSNIGLEIHLLEKPALGWPVQGDLIHVDWLRYMRNEQRFESVDALREQIAEDVANARLYFEKNKQ
jgi:riboflavin kinase/FMN adenylyltransferase